MGSEEEAALNHSDQESEEYIDMEVSSSSSSNLLCYYSSTSSPPQTREFEFQMTSSFHHERSQTSSSPADELFYNGKLLPLYLPPRLQMLQTLLQTERETEQITTSLTPLQSSSSSSINESSSPTESCRESCELNPDEQQLFSLIHGSLSNPKKNSWPYKLKNQIKQSYLLGQKLKASRVYLKSLFSKSAFCSDGSGCAKETCNALSNKYMKRKKIPTGKIDLNHRRSFSGVIQRGSEFCSSSRITTSSSSGCSSLSSSFSFSSNNGFYDLQFFKRSGSANLAETETSIEGAIAYCKQSHSRISHQPHPFFSADQNRGNSVESDSERGR